MRPMILFLLMLTGVLAGCDSGDGSEPGRAGAGARRSVVVSIFPLESLVREIVGEGFDVQTLLPPGSSAHGHEATPQQMMSISRAGALVVVDLGIDPWARQAWQAAGSSAPQLLSLAALLEMGGDDEPHDHDHAHPAEHGGHAQDHGEHGHGHEHGGTNGHIWLDPVLMQEAVAKLGTALAQRWPEEREAIASNTAALIERLAALDATYRQTLGQLAQKRMITFHNAFDLLAARYGMSIAAHLLDVGMESGGEVTPARLMAAIAEVREHGVPAIYAEPQFSDQAAAAIAAQTGVRVYRLDPLGHPGMRGYDDYFAMMRSNLRMLEAGQTGKAAAPGADAAQ